MKQLSKVNQKIKDLVEEVIAIQDYDTDSDFNTRENHIVANIKVYEWLDTDDVLQVIKDNDTYNVYKDAILEEFCEDRLSDLYNHTCEMEVEYLKDQYEGAVHLNSDEEDYKKLNTFERECWQFGRSRSGGWFSLCEIDQLESQEFESWNFHTGSYLLDLEDAECNKEFNRVLKDDLAVCSANDKRVFINELETFISEWNEKFDNIQYFIKQIEDSTKCFKETVLHNLDFEISQFIEDLDIEDTNVVINLKDDKIKTSLGITVNKEEFIQAYKQNEPLFRTLKSEGDIVHIKMKVGGYRVEYAKRIKDDILIKAGCHQFSLNNIKSVLG